MSSCHLLKNILYVVIIVYLLLLMLGNPFKENFWTLTSSAIVEEKEMQERKLIGAIYPPRTGGLRSGMPSKGDTGYTAIYSAEPYMVKM